MLDDSLAVAQTMSLVGIGEGEDQPKLWESLACGNIVAFALADTVSG
jgi:hypothetical protein